MNYILLLHFEQLHATSDIQTMNSFLLALVVKSAVCPEENPILQKLNPLTMSSLHPNTYHTIVLKGVSLVYHIVLECL